MADPSGAPPQPGPNDISTAILRPKKSYVYPLLPYPYRSDVVCRPNRLIVDEASSDDNSGKYLLVSTVVILIERNHSRDSEPRDDGDPLAIPR